MEENRLDRIEKIMLCFFIVYLIVSIPMGSLGFVHLYMIWNVFLSLLPLFFAKRLRGYLDYYNKKIIVIILFILWFIFFPNAAYMVTDFIHISNQPFFIKSNIYGPTMYNMNIYPWLKLIHITVGETLAAFSGMLSLYIVHGIIVEKKGKLIGCIILEIICILSGYAIYVGRFLRFNSWDILRPFHLLSELALNFNSFTLSFSFLLSIYILFSYTIFCLFYKK
ncbi:DUF1361 domain-containing protein [Clostridium sp. 19966]|uniref:DUF1361 domain-containing protein n=1 Tax=Clostridium sp. 19966 TaxID=2768166 RepID=UPI0028E0738B|nr:DUF1361 domain-containing protein [Clostridium sp. 19966]MDT8715203.1 DUF1361 domain-containing protein [Clostridium sp. 19966]